MLTILDIDDVEMHTGSKIDRWLDEIESNFMRPVTDAALSQQLQQFVAQIDPAAAQKIHKAMGGDDGES